LRADSQKTCLVAGPLLVVQPVKGVFDQFVLELDEAVLVPPPIIQGKG
jgi:hypothetical protein